MQTLMSRRASYRCRSIYQILQPFCRKSCIGEYTSFLAIDFRHFLHIPRTLSIGYTNRHVRNPVQITFVASDFDCLSVGQALLIGLVRVLHHVDLRHCILLLHRRHS